ncbi:MAG: DUF502 domain-containing protein [Candidatus Cardinium sp.]|nr:DUF502 domain-containing protein [Candidatus Cardinium sp.]
MRGEQSLINRLLHYFFRGVLLFIPLGGTLYFISLVLRKIDGIANFSPIPGLGMLIIIVALTLLGYVGTALLVKSAFSFTEALIQKVPFIRVLYASLKDLTTAFVSSSSKGKFDRPVMVLMDRSMQIYRIGFITKSSLEVLAMPDYIAVYFPNSYDLSGLLLMLPPTLVTPLDLPSEEVMRFILSGGIASFKEEKPTNSTKDNDSEQKNCNE